MGKSQPAAERYVFVAECSTETYAKAVCDALNQSAGVEAAVEALKAARAEHSCDWSGCWCQKADAAIAEIDKLRGKL